MNEITILGLPTMVLAQAGQPEAGAAPATPVNAVGVPGAPAATPTTTGTGQGTTTPPGSGQLPPKGSTGFEMMLPLVLVMVLFIVLQIFSSKKDRKRREALLNSIQKLDRVVAAGGIIGKVVDITNDEVVLELEDGRMRVARASVTQVIQSGRSPKADSLAEPKFEAQATRT